jgi:hypothetical protein
VRGGVGVRWGVAQSRQEELRGAGDHRERLVEGYE